MTGNTWILIGVIAAALAAFALPYGFYIKSKAQSETTDTYQRNIDRKQNFIPTNEGKNVNEETKVNQETKEDAVIDWFNKLEKPLDPIKFKNAIDHFNSLKLSKKYKIELSIKRKNGTILSGFSTGSHGWNATKGYRYFIESEIGISQGAILLTDIESILDFKIIKNF